MAYEPQIVRDGMLAGAWLGTRGVNSYDPSCAHPYYDYTEKCVAEKSDETSEKIVYGTKVFGVAHDGTIVLVHVTSATASWGKFWKRKSDDLLRPLSEAAETGNTSKFLTSVEDINWNRRSAEEYIRAIDLALKVGAHLTARDLATQR